MARSLKFFSLTLCTLWLISSCSVDRHPTQKDTPPGPLPPNSGARPGNRALIINGLSENFSVVNELAATPSITNHVRMYPNDESDAHPCQAPNDIMSYGDYFYVTCSLSQNIHVFQRSDLQPKRIFQLSDGINPWQTTVLNPGKAYVSSYLKGKVLIINPSVEPVDKRVLGEIDLSTLPLETDGQETRPRPEGMTLFNGRLYVAIANLNRSSVAGGPGYVAVIDTATDRLVKLIKTSGRNTVSVFHSDLEPFRNRVFALSAGNYRVGTDGGFLGDGRIDVINAETDVLEGGISTGGAPFEMALAPDGTAYASNGKEGIILVFNATTREVLPSIDLRANRCHQPASPRMSYLSALVLNGPMLLATEFNSNCLIGVDLATRRVSFEMKTGDGPDVMALW